MDVMNYLANKERGTFQENPTGTKEGQLIVSITENIWVRLTREGRLSGRNVTNIALPNDGLLKMSTASSSPDTIFYPRYATVSANVDSDLVVQINSGIPQVSSFYAFRGFVKAGTPVIITFDGDCSVTSAGNIAIGAINAGVSAGFYGGTIMGYEVSKNV